MAKKKVTLTLEDGRDLKILPRYADCDFRIRLATNTTEFRIDQGLTVREVDEILERSDHEVRIIPRK